MAPFRRSALVSLRNRPGGAAGQDPDAVFTSTHCDRIAVRSSGGAVDARRSWSLCIEPRGVRRDPALEHAVRWCRVCVRRVLGVDRSTERPEWSKQSRNVCGLSAVLPTGFGYCATVAATPLYAALWRCTKGHVRDYQVFRHDAETVGDACAARMIYVKDVHPFYE